MEKFIFKDFIEGVLKNIELSRPSGGGGGFHVYIDKFYNGVFDQRDGEWVYLGHHLQEHDIITIIKRMQRFEHHIFACELTSETGGNTCVDVFNFDQFFEVDLDGHYQGSVLMANDGFWQQSEGLPMSADLIDDVGYRIQHHYD